MGRKSKYSADFKLMIIHEAETLGITRTSRKYSISDHTIRTWKLIYKYQGIQGLEPTHIQITHIPENTRHHWLKNIRSQMRSLKSSPSDTG